MHFLAQQNRDFKLLHIYHKVNFWLFKILSIGSKSLPILIGLIRFRDSFRFEDICIIAQTARLMVEGRVWTQNHPSHWTTSTVHTTWLGSHQGYILFSLFFKDLLYHTHTHTFPQITLSFFFFFDCYKIRMLTLIWKSSVCVTFAHYSSDFWPVSPALACSSWFSVEISFSYMV